MNQHHYPTILTNCKEPNCHGHIIYCPQCMMSRCLDCGIIYNLICVDGVQDIRKVQNQS